MESSAEANAELRTRVRQQEIVAELGRRALEADDLDELMSDAAKTVAETLDTDYGAVLEYFPVGDEALVRRGAGWRDGLVGTATVSADRNSQVGYTLRREKPVIVDDLGADERFSGPELLASHDVTSAISAIVGSVDDSWGVLGAYATERRAFTEHDANFVRSVANVIASAIENERTQSELREIYGRISDAFFALDKEWRFTHLNDRAHEMINPEGRTLVGKQLWEVFPAAIDRTFESKYERAMYEQETVSFEEYYPEPLDSWFEVRAYPSETGLSVYFRDVTERKRARQQLEEERDMFAQGPAIVFRWKAEEGWPVEHVSDNVEDVLGYAPAELESGDVPYTDLLLDDDIDRIAREVEENSDEATERFSHDPYRVETGDGDVRWVEDTTKILRDESGEITHYLGYLVDITERKERERELRRKERRFEAIFEDPNILVGLLDPDGTVLDINGTAMEYIDADLAEVTGEPFWETPWWGAGDDVRDDVERWTERAAAGEYVDFEADLTRPDGQRYTLEGVFRPVTNDDGDVVSVIVSDRDVTERKERERALEQSEQRYRTLAESFPNGIVTLFDEDLRYTLAAGRAFDDLPVSRDDIEGRTPHEGWNDDVAEALTPALRSALDGEEESVELSYVGREWVVHVVPITDENGDVFAGMTMAQDITERKENQRKLEETVEKLEESNERLDSFASMLAHELRNPVTIGQIYSDQLPDEAAPEAVEYVSEAFDRIEDMIDVMLVLTRGRDAVSGSDPVDLAEVTRAAWADVDAPEASLDVVVDHTIRADETYVRHLFRNLFENAVEHGGSDVTITVGELPTGFYVADDGTGIPADERDAVFEEGYTTSPGQGGTGLGLAFVEKLADIYGWECAVTESASGGARFEFTDVDRNSRS